MLASKEGHLDLVKIFLAAGTREDREATNNVGGASMRMQATEQPYRAVLFRAVSYRGIGCLVHWPIDSGLGWWERGVIS